MRSEWLDCVRWFDEFIRELKHGFARCFCVCVCVYARLNVVGQTYTIIGWVINHAGANSMPYSTKLLGIRKRNRKDSRGNWTTNCFAIVCAREMHSFVYIFATINLHNFYDPTQVQIGPFVRNAYSSRRHQQTGPTGMVPRSYKYTLLYEYCT